MGTNYNQIDWFTNFTAVIAAGESRKISKLGKYITILSNSGADPRIQINGQNGGIVPSGLSIELPPSENFDKLEFVNESSDSITMQIAVSNGKIIDSRTVLSGSVEVKADPLNTPLPTNDQLTQDKLDAVITTLNSQSNTLGTNRATQLPISTTALPLITTTENSGGVIIKTLNAQATSNNTLGIYIDTTAPSAWNDVSKFRFANVTKDSFSLAAPLILPSGLGVWVIATGPSSSNAAAISWDDV
jgi:hypothetical protein